MAAEKCFCLAVLLLATGGCGAKTKTRAPDTSSQDMPLVESEIRQPIAPSPSEIESSPQVPPGMAFIEGGQGIIEFREVTVPSFYYDLHETTVEEYRACVEAGACTAPHGAEWNTPACTWNKADHDRYPITCIDAYQAEAYCAWKDKRLPSQYGWGWAARSGPADLPYPWGHEPTSCEYANVNSEGEGCGFHGPWPVGTRPAGASKQGVHDLVGNVWEWTGTRIGEGGLSVGGGWPNNAAGADPKLGFVFP